MRYRLLFTLNKLYTIFKLQSLKASLLGESGVQMPRQAKQAALAACAKKRGEGQVNPKSPNNCLEAVAFCHRNPIILLELGLLPCGIPPSECPILKLTGPLLT